MVDGIKRATHDAEPVPLMRLGTALPGQACRARWQRHPVALAMRATPADRPGDQQQDEEHAEREDLKLQAGIGSSRVTSVSRSVSPRVIPRSVAAQSRLWVTRLLRAHSAGLP